MARDRSVWDAPFIIVRNQEGLFSTSIWVLLHPNYISVFFFNSDVWFIPEIRSMSAIFPDFSLFSLASFNGIKLNVSLVIHLNK